MDRGIGRDIFMYLKTGRDIPRYLKTDLGRDIHRQRQTHRQTKGVDLKSSGRLHVAIDGRACEKQTFAKISAHSKEGRMRCVAFVEVPLALRSIPTLQVNHIEHILRVIYDSSVAS